jgi:hypothetical protein
MYVVKWIKTSGKRLKNVAFQLYDMLEKKTPNYSNSKNLVVLMVPKFEQNTCSSGESILCDTVMVDIQLYVFVKNP